MRTVRLQPHEPPLPEGEGVNSKFLPHSEPAVTSAIILAGGLGTRLRGAVPDLPKPMAPVAGRPFLAHQMDHWIAEGVKHFVLSVGYRSEAIRSHFGRRYRGVRLDYAVEAMPLGTGGALLLAAGLLPNDAPALLLNGDTYFDVKLAALAAHAQRLDAQWCFALFHNTDPARYMGVGLASDGRITALQSSGSALANGGVYLFRPSALAGWPQRRDAALSLETALFPALLAQGQSFAGLACGGAFIDIGVPADYHRAASVLPGAHQQEPAHVHAG
jgi:D-glycero-alpha-D-manno-heptose 1-phosphate guanylyltransferase